MNEVTKHYQTTQNTSKNPSSTVLSLGIPSVESSHDPIHWGSGGYRTRNADSSLRSSNTTYSVRSYDGSTSIPGTKLGVTRRAPSSNQGRVRTPVARVTRQIDGGRPRMKKLAKHRHRFLPFYIGAVVVAEAACLIFDKHPF